MCGIMGYIGYNDAVKVIIDGLAKLEYRGYDSSGIAMYNNGIIEVCKKKGRLADMLAELGEGRKCNLGIGHTRWATHGVPSDINAHPHTDCTGKIALVHNGIIENYASLRKVLIEEGHIFVSETDTEVMAHLIEKHYHGSLEQAVRQALAQVRGSFAIVVISSDEPDKIVAAKKDSPLIIGLGRGENYVASDIPAILGLTSEVYIIEENELVVLTPEQAIITDFQGNLINKEVFKVDWDPIAAEKNGYEHFMLKEIFEQPKALRDTVTGKIKQEMADLSGIGLDDTFRKIKKIFIVACGTAYHAGLVGRLAIEKLARVPVETDLASEFRYREVLWGPDDLMIVISQSGETADTLAALREAKRQGLKVLAVTNVVGSSIAREADQVIYTHAGPEIAVASTKAYTTQLATMYMIAMHIARIKDACSSEKLEELARDLAAADLLVQRILDEEKRTGKIKQLAWKYQSVESTFFLGRGLDYAVAMEGALKLKEISYVHAEAYAAGELKHGPLALIHDGVPVFTLVTQGHLLEKTMSNIKEVKARGAIVIAICNESLNGYCQEFDEKIVLPDINPLLASILSVVPLQIFAYYMAIFRGADVDKPRNLAKSVTVE
jgi:glucosamine--fructose-6-phosphate aminotransferase (isomerizing)